MNDELRQIKKIYGEEMMHLCRELFPTILEKNGRLLEILTQKIAPTRSLAELIKEMDFKDEFKNWVYNHFSVEKEEKVVTTKSPFELMDEAGYTLYECHNEDEIQAFRRFYANGEELCTFRGGRLDRCLVFFAVKKNVDEIKREDYQNPRRQDDYGTSVISIQFSRGNYSTVSIKNRYNHTVENPDSTFSNDLEKIIPGLTNSFERYCNIKLQQSLADDEFMEYMSFLPAKDGKYYYLNVEQDDVLFCENNIIIDKGKIIDTYAKNKERYLLIDQYIVDMKEKTIFSPIADPEDAFIKSILGVGAIKNITITKNGENRIINIFYNNEEKIEIEINKHNSIVGYDNKHVKKIDDKFLNNNPNVQRISLDEVEKIGDDFASSALISDVSLPKVRTIGSNFLRNSRIKELSLPEVEEIGDRFLVRNQPLRSLSLPKVEMIGDGFLASNQLLKTLSLPEVKSIGSKCLTRNALISSLSLPKVMIIGDEFLMEAEAINDVSLPEVREIGSWFLSGDSNLENISLPKAEIIGSSFLVSNEKISDISLPEAKAIGSYFMLGNYNLKSISFPKIRNVSDRNNFVIRDAFSKQKSEVIDDAVIDHPVSHK